MGNGKSSGGNFVVALLFFVVTVLAASCILLTAFVVWLSELLGSLPVAAGILGGCFTLIALCIYLFSLRRSIERMRERMETVYDVAQLAKEGYDWVNDKFHRWIQRLLTD